MKEYFVGTDDFQRAHKVNAMISANALVRINNGVLQVRKAPIRAGRWMMDSGAFSQVTKYGDFIMSPEEYVRIAVRFQDCGDLACIVTQDYMCEPDVIKMLQGMGKEASVRIHQRKTVERYIQIMNEAEKQGLKVPVMPVLQGWEVEDYVDHYLLYRRMLPKDDSLQHPFHHPIALDSPKMPNGQWVGIGSTCKRNKNPEVVSKILDALEECSESKYSRIPEGIVKSMKVHLFGYKTTGLKSDRIKDRIYSADSFAYDFTNRLNGVVRKRTDRIKSAKEFGNKIVHNDVQTTLALA
jgi:hypothetical protein